MKKLLYILGSALLKKVLLPPAGSGLTSQSQAFPKLNVPYLTDLAQKYVNAACLGLVFSLFFVAGTTMAIFSAAQSFDLFGVVVLGAVFYSGIALMALSLVVIASCYYSILNNKIQKEQIYIIEESAPPLRTPLDYLGLAQPFFHGLVNGWGKERETKKFARAQQERPPAKENPKHVRAQAVNADNVTDFRAG